MRKWKFSGLRIGGKNGNLRAILKIFSKTHFLGLTLGVDSV
jgi:hypothetical protein